MGAASSRIGDIVIGMCVCHSPPIPMVGVIVTGAPTVIDEGAPSARIGDSVVGCLVGTVVTGASIVEDE